MLGGVEKLPPDLRCFQIPTKLFECGFDRYVCAYDFRVKSSGTGTGNLSPVSIQTQSLALATMIGCLPTQAIAFGWNRALVSW